MSSLQTIICCVYIIITVINANDNINCPRFCKCDSYQQLNRAQCSSKNLISAELDLPNQVEILDLSFNDITTLDNKCFEKYFHLLHLNLSHNALQSLQWDTFFKLRKLRDVNLSYNRLEYVDERWFIKNKHLNKINLSGNKLQTLENKPLLRNAFVVELNLKNSQINLLQPQLFAGLTNVKYLDLSENLLNNFKAQDFQQCMNLRNLNLNDNFIKCSREIKNEIKQMENKGIQVSFKECKDEKKAQQEHREQMFEKLVMPAKTENEKDENLLNPINHWRLNLDQAAAEMEDDEEEEEFESHKILTSSNEWLRFAPDAILCDKPNPVLCQEYRSCLTRLSVTWHDNQHFKELCSVNDIKFAFVMGIAIGVAAIVFILVCTLCVKRCWEVKKSVPTIVDNNDDLPNQPLARPTSQLPPHVRRQPRRRAARPARSMVRYEGPVSENFISRLFGRPARHQYYRTINQNTATLIRRLSRSNLFNNRLNQHFMERQSSAEANSSETQDFPASAPRPETPPPSYGDVVIKN